LYLFKNRYIPLEIDLDPYPKTLANSTRFLSIFKISSFKKNNPKKQIINAIKKCFRLSEKKSKTNTGYIFNIIEI